MNTVHHIKLIQSRGLLDFVWRGFLIYVQWWSGEALWTFFVTFGFLDSSKKRARNVTFCQLCAFASLKGMNRASRVRFIDSSFIFFSSSLTHLRKTYDTQQLLHDFQLIKKSVSHYFSSTPTRLQNNKTFLLVRALSAKP